jgi:predicted CxxxxCH...CXXCH cytochrome family protein
VVGCHDRGGAWPRPAWSDRGPLACGDCHATPPAKHYAGPCTTCHHEANAAGTALAGGPLHANGTIDVGDGSGKCGACHGRGDDPWPTSKVHQAHASPGLTSPIACASCHPVPEAIAAPGHMDGVVQITFTGRALARGAAPRWNGATCAEVACHGANLPDPPATPAWSDVSGREAACNACHGAPPTQHTTSTSCARASCHGSEVGPGPTILPAGRATHIDGVAASDR